MTHFSIKDLAEFSGLKQHTIRIWEQRYSLLNPVRAASSHRTYTADELHVLLDAVLLNQNGYKISSIARMALDEKLRSVSEITDKQQKTIHELIIGMAKMDAAGFEQVLDESTRTWGIHATVEQVLLPFCDMVGLLENSNVRNYVENILVIRQGIKQRLHAGINALPNPGSSQKVLLFLPHGALQELTLLYLHYLLKRNGYVTVHLGHHVSTEQLLTICIYTKPDFLATHNSKKSSQNSDLCAFVEHLPEVLPGSVFISLEHALPLNGHCTKHHRHATSLSEALELIIAPAGI